MSSEGNGRVKFISSFIVVSGNTLISRILGFFRDVLQTHYLGASIWSDIFNISLKIPNLFRRFFAEGAFNLAFVPIFSEIRTVSGSVRALHFARQSFTWLALVLFIFVIFFEIFAFDIVYLIAPGFKGDYLKIESVVYLTRIMMPYLLFVALMTMLTGVSNAMGRFKIGALAPVLMNVFMIVTFLATGSLAEQEIIEYVSYSVAVSGFVQFAWAFYSVNKGIGRIVFVKPKITRYIKKLLLRMGPVMLGAGVYQINLFVDMIFASYLPTGSVSYLSYADRINQLPLAVVGTAIATVLLPLLSQQIYGGTNRAALIQTRSIVFAMVFALPAAILFIILSEVITLTLFQSGRFLLQDTIETARALEMFALSLPAIITIKVVSPSFYSYGDTKTPVYIAFFAIIVNITIAYLIIDSYAHVGLAIAATTASWVTAFIMIIFLLLKKRLAVDLDSISYSIRILFSSIIIAIIAYYGVGLESLFNHEDKFMQYITLGGLLSLCGLVYLLCLYFLGVLKKPKEFLGC